MINQGEKNSILKLKVSATACKGLFLIFNFMKFPRPFLTLSYLFSPGIGFSPNNESINLMVEQIKFIKIMKVCPYFDFTAGLNFFDR